MGEGRWKMEATALNPLGEKREDRREQKIPGLGW